MQELFKEAEFWDVTPCSLVGTDRRFRGVYCLYHRGDSEGLRRHFENMYLPLEYFFPLFLRYSKISSHSAI
jgi:hypothetical protein